MAKRWCIHSHDPDRIASLMRTANVSAVVAQLLVARDITDPSIAREFLDPKLTQLRDPFDLPGMESGVEIILASVAAKERIIVHGDYDADGMTGTAILVHCLKLLGADVGFYVPNRLNEGYGLGSEALGKLAADGTKLIITVDCGIASVDEALVARELGMKLVITDHHALAESLPAADAIVHPDLPGTDYPFTGLAGAGVAFKLAWALCQRQCGATKVSPPMREFLLKAIGLAAIGTVADVVPLVDENRILVHHGLVSLFQRPVLGVKHLLELTELTSKPALASEDIAFTLAPRLNAAGRLGQAQLAIELLTTDDPQRAHDLADYVGELNKSRDHLDRSVYLAAHKQAQEDFDPHNDPALVLAGRGWHAGVIGIVAGRLSDKYHKPVMLISLDEMDVKPGVGSARSIPGFDLHQGLAACTEHLIKHGGHKAAAGFKIEPSRVEAFREAFCRHAESNITEEQRTAELSIDAESPLSALTLRALEQIDRLAPFGQSNRRPLLCTSGVTLADAPKTMGGGGRHLSLSLNQAGVRMRGVAFGGGEWAEPLSKVEGPLAIAFRPVINTFRGRRNVELHIVDWRPASEIEAELNSRSSAPGDPVPSVNS